MPRFEHAGTFSTIQLTGKQLTTQLRTLGSAGLPGFAMANRDPRDTDEDPRRYREIDD